MDWSRWLQLGTLLMFVMTVDTSAGALGSPCAVWNSPLTGQQVDCSNLQLQQVPDDLPRTTTHLDLSFNRFSNLGAFTFKHVPLLVSLNLTRSGVHVLHNKTFSGLDKLQELYIPCNPVLSRLPKAVFQDLRSLHTLHMWNEKPGYRSFQAISNMKTLTNLAITPNTNAIPRELLSLHNLKILTLAYGSIRNLTHELLAPLSTLVIEEIAFQNCDIRIIENGSFDNFSSLRLLNFACNMHLRLSNIIDAISTSSNINVTELITDVVNIKEWAIIGPEDTPQCRQAWTNLQKLSIKGIGPILLTNLSHMLECFYGLESCSISHNTVLPLQGIRFRSFWQQYMKMSLISVDASYLTHDNDHRIARRTCMCDGLEANYIIRNQERFPPLFEPATNCLFEPITFPNITKDECPNSHIAKIYVPPCLSYFDIHGSLLSKIGLAPCAVMSRNNLHYIDISYFLTAHPLTLNQPIIGLNKLTVFNSTNSRLTSIKNNFFAYAPSLKSLLLANNLFNQSDLPFLSGLMELELLDLSGNRFVQINANSFSNYPSLKHLSLARNQLESASFILNMSISVNYLDLSSNKLTTLPENVTLWLDKISEIHNVTIYLSNNQWLCSCSNLNFIRWLKKTNVFILEKNNLQCLADHGKVTIVEVDTEALDASCQSTNMKIALSTGITGTVVVIAAAMSMIYCLRWKIRWTYYRIKYISRRKNEYLLDDMSTVSTYNAYIIFSMNDDVVRHWVAHDLSPRVEEEWNQGPLFLPGLRDDIGGVADVDNITDGLMSSQTAIWILSPAFFEDRHCEIAAHFAFHHLGAKRNLLVVWEKRLSEYQFPRHFLNLLNKKNGIPRITFSDDTEDAENLFWARLETFLSPINQSSEL